MAHLSPQMGNSIKNVFFFSKEAVVWWCCRYMVRSFTFILPYFPTGTMERVDMEGQVATAKVIVYMSTWLCLHVICRTVEFYN